MQPQQSDFWSTAFALEDAVASLTRQLQCRQAEQQDGRLFLPPSVSPVHVESAPSTSHQLAALELAVDDVLSHTSPADSATNDYAAFQTQASVARAWDTSAVIPALLSSIEAIGASAQTVGTLVNSPQLSPQQLSQLQSDSSAASLFSGAVHTSSLLDELERHVAALELQLPVLRACAESDAE